MRIVISIIYTSEGGGVDPRRISRKRQKISIIKCLLDKDISDLLKLKMKEPTRYGEEANLFGPQYLVTLISKRVSLY